jgi:DNA ligase (NAD+)
MEKLDRVRFLVLALNAYTKDYDEGNPKITDEEWDNMYFELQNLEQETGLILPTSPTQTIHYEVVNALAKSEHNHKMLSLDKTKSLDEVASFLGDKEYLAMLKMDGLTCSVTYRNGELVSAETRGNGLVGEDVLHNAMNISGIPRKIPCLTELTIDGEIICTYTNFEKFSGDYKNPRNFAAGSIRLLDSKECASRGLKFIAAFLFTANASNEVVVSQNVIEMNAADEWDDVLKEYEAYVDKYIACMKKVKAGDLSAMADLAELMEKAESLSSKLEKAEDEMSTAQAARYAKIAAKLAKAAKNL